MKKILMAIVGVLAMGFVSAQVVDNIIMEAGVAVIKGRIVGWQTGMKNPDLVLGSEKVTIEVAADGTFLAMATLPHTRASYVRLKEPFALVTALLTPGDTVEMTIDLNKAPAKRADLVAQQFVSYTGPNAKLNNELGMINIFYEYVIELSPDAAADTLAKMTPDQQGQYLWDIHKTLVKRINKNKKLSPETRLFLNVRADYDLLYALSTAPHIVMWEQGQQSMAAALPARWFTKLVDTYLVGPEIFAYTNLEPSDLRTMAIRCAPTSRSGKTMNDIVQYAIDSLPVLTLAQRDSLTQSLDLIEQPNATKEQNEQAIAIIGSILNKYEEQVKESVQCAGIRAFTRSGQSALLELVQLRKYQQKLENRLPLTPEDFEQMKGEINTLTCYIDYLRLKNDELLATLEANKSRSGCQVLELGEIPASQVLPTLTAKFPGKVLFLDFWATWCGPCRAAMRDTEPAKGEFSTDKVAFIYLTNPTSPRQTWENMIPEIAGTHIMLTQEQWNYLVKELGIDGIPSYLVLDPSGQKSHFQVGAISADEMRQQINKALNK